MPSRHRRLVPVIPFVLLIAACGSNPSTSPSPPPPTSAEPSQPAETAAPSIAPQAGQTDTDWGRVWDALPAGFPRYPGAAAADDASAAPASGRYAVAGGDPEEIAAWLQAAMETATFSTDVSGPLEDGSFTLDSMGDGKCRIQTTIAPLGEMTFVTVLYGADCPNG
jgi:hypothetical protein